MKNITGVPSRQVFLRAVELNATECNMMPDALHRIFRGALDVLVIRGAFSPVAMGEVVDTLAHGGHDFFLTPQEIPDLRTEQIIVYGDGIQPNFVEGNGPPIDRYLGHASQWRSACRDLFKNGMDYEARMNEIFTAMSGGRSVRVPTYSDGRSYCPSTIRRVPPGHAVPFHVGNYFLYLDGYKHLSTVIELRDQISFFTTMSPSEAGGDIEVYELRFDDPRARGINSYGTDQHTPFAFQAFPMRAGDLFIFDGGRFWHRVSEVRGPRPRWTIGGFCGFGIDDRMIYYWG